MEERKGMPLLGERFPEMRVRTTHGEKVLPFETVKPKNF
jgi:hypothetical protein